ncbi:hypothetical protein [Stieleria neptunia]|uniref:hypothetical protein n=1 Tax=Stieleria neptunia TaxID=2527979 RepID=UPI0011A51B2A|nr:hypothetical protein [Stieleria neptunia]
MALTVFSKDRPLQLDALLRSVREHLSGDFEITVLWKASNEGFLAAYGDVFGQLRGMNIRSIEESEFLKDTIEALEQTPAGSVMFLVDDILFIREFRTEWLKRFRFINAVPSTRLDSQVTYCQPHECESPVPRLKAAGYEPWRSFSWRESIGGWAMPLALDGNVFSRREVVALLKSIECKNPNSLEAAFGPYRFWFKYRKGYCLTERCIQNFALNRVQTENETFPCGEYSSEAMLEKWNQGFRLDIEKMAEIKSNSTHIVCEPVFESRRMIA